METRIEKHFGSIEGLEVIELGSGMGSQSLVMALKGAHVTLVDISEKALKLAKGIFNRFGLDPVCCRADILNLDSHLLHKFDISMSFGTIEHFFDEELRKKAMNSHYQVLRKGGVSFVAVPNEMCPHHKIFSSLIKITRLAKGPPEKPFTTPELIEYAKQVGFSRAETFGGSILEFDYLMPYLFMPVQIQIATPLDNFFSADITLFAQK